MHDSVVHVNSDGTTDVVIAYTNHSLISVDGIVTPDFIGINTVEHSLPLGRRYMTTARSFLVVLDISSKLNAIPWWNVGRVSRQAVTLTWNIGHDVANSAELVHLHLPPWLFQAVMTYNLLTGLMLHLVVLPSLFCTPTYNASMNGNLISSSSSVFSFCPWPTTVMTFFLHGTIILAIVVVWNGQHNTVADDFNKAPFLLALNISGVARSSGSLAPPPSYKQ
ncbi:Aste57867_9712 [Aphanomyces stellatus]|uniref:Aste57867_9712 protein n=1 Tax=Aphanomyces stellatus TaxID=120398 RepID=A0A485KP55_9STRA|nr:hypothetical protein As57867_009674 [Aphanomyces stellatus]VFT86591.1 Aste57867_9712 [Aphanomyces stellatus]